MSSGCANDMSAGDHYGCPSGNHALRFRRTGSASYHLRTAISQVGAQPTRARLATTMSSVGNHAEAKAEELPQSAKATRKRLFGLDYMQLLQTAVMLGDVLRKQGKYVRAAAAYHSTLAAPQCVLGSGHPETLCTMYSLGGGLSSGRVGTPRRSHAGRQCL